jgi:hypothetical protein
MSNIVAPVIGQITNTIFTGTWGVVPSPSYRTLTVSGTTITSTTDAESVNFLSSTTRNTLLTSSNIIVAGIGSTAVRTASYTTGNIGAITNTTYITDNSGAVTWYPVGTTRMLAIYIATTGALTLKSFTVNQTTGALTLVGTLSPVAFNVGNPAFKNATSGAFYFNSTGGRANSISLTAGGDFSIPTFNTGGVGVPSQIVNGSLPTYTTGDTFLFLNSGNAGLAPTITPYTVNAYATNAFNYSGVCKTSTSSSPVDLDFSDKVSQTSTPNSSIPNSSSPNSSIPNSSSPNSSIPNSSIPNSSIPNSSSSEGIFAMSP